MPKIAVLSDVHGNIVALEKVVEDLKIRQVDCVFNLGDHVSGPLWPEETAQFLMKQDWVQIAGNHDRQLVHQDPNLHIPSDRHAFQALHISELDWLKTLPIGSVAKDGFLLFHGTPSSDTTYLLETLEHGAARLAEPNEIEERLKDATSRIMLCGHTHIPRVVVKGDTLIINPGSVGLPAYDDEFPEYHVMETGSPHARYAILENRNGDWQPEMISVPYDHQKAAAQARENGRPDWEIGLRTGFMQH